MVLNAGEGSVKCYSMATRKGGYNSHVKKLCTQMHIDSW